jgi:lipoprotein-anchoring transpeptidase ErfK/SrfK
MTGAFLLRRASAAAAGVALTCLIAGGASAQNLAYNFNWPNRDGALSDRSPLAEMPTAAIAGDDDMAPELRRQVVSYPTSEPRGTVIIDTAHTFLYLTLGDGKALRYGIGVGRKGFTWSGVERISRKSEWPDWVPPPQMIARQPYLPRWVSGGPGNPLGARALYLGNTDYRIHGTNNPASIGQQVSSGCIRMRDADVIDLYSRVSVGTKIIVLATGQRSAAVEERSGVTISRGDAGLMAARVQVRSGSATGAAMPQSGVAASNNPSPLGRIY